MLGRAECFVFTLGIGDFGSHFAKVLVAVLGKVLKGHPLALVVLFEHHRLRTWRFELDANIRNSMILVHVQLERHIARVLDGFLRGVNSLRLPPVLVCVVSQSIRPV